MRAEQTARGLVVAMVAATLQLAGASAASAALIAPPTMFPADGAVVHTTDLTATATYAAPLSTSVPVVHVGAQDVTTSSSLGCLDGFTGTEGDKAVRCHLPELVPGHTYEMTSSVKSREGSRVDRTTFTVSTPRLDTTWPAQGQVLATTAGLPGPDHPVTAAYDVALDAATTTARLVSEGPQRTAVPASVVVSGSSVTVTPAEVVAPGEYALVLSAVDATDAAVVTPSTVEFLVDDRKVLPAKPPRLAPRSTCCTDPGDILLAAPVNVPVDLVVYDPTNPAAEHRVEGANSTFCSGPVPIGTSCVALALPVSGLAAGSYAWYAQVRIGGMVLSTVDHPLALADAGPAAPTNVNMAPLSPTDPPYLHVTADVGPEVLGVTVGLVAFRGLSPSATVAASGGHIDTYLPATFVDDGIVPITVAAYNRAGRSSTPLTVTTPKDAIDLAVIRPAPTAPVRQGPFILYFNEGVRDDSTLVLRDPSGAVVPATLASGRPSAGVLALATTGPLTTSGTYHLDITAYARDCVLPATDSCEQVVATRDVPVDVTPPAPPTAVDVSPRAPAAAQPVTVTGRGEPSDHVVVTVGTGVDQAQKVLDVGAADSTGSAAWTTGPLGLSAQPRTMLPVTLLESDTAYNTTTTSLGTVDHRKTTVLRLASASPTSIPYGTTTTVTGRLLNNETGAVLGGRQVRLFQVDARGHQKLLAATVTAATGWFSRPLVLSSSGPITAQYPGSSTERSASGSTVRVAVGALGRTPVDHPDSLAAASRSAASPQNRILAERLTSLRDQDVFTFGVQTAGYHRVLLGHLSGNAALELYDRRGRRVAASDQPGQQFEELYTYLPAGTYAVRVHGVSGSVSAQPYHLSFSRVPAGVVALSRRLSTSYGLVTYQADVLNNSPQPRLPTFLVQCVDASGRVRSGDTYYVTGVLPSQARIPVSFSAPVCSGDQHRRFTLQGAVSTYRVTTGIRLRFGASVPFHSHGTTGRLYPFTATNTGKTTIRDVSVFVAEYDAEGILVALGSAYVFSVAPGKTITERSLEIDFTPVPNRVRYAIVG